jgi:hypothetical protein
MIHVKLENHPLLVIPCSGAKRRGSGEARGQSILSTIDPRYAATLASARSALRYDAQVDDTLMCALQRYDGELYQGASNAIATYIKSGGRVMIVSGGYGLLLPYEPIGWYNRGEAGFAWRIGG